MKLSGKKIILLLATSALLAACARTTTTNENTSNGSGTSSFDSSNNESTTSSEISISSINYNPNECKNHQLIETVKKEATLLEKGSKHYHCDNCGADFDGDYYKMDEFVFEDELKIEMHKLIGPCLVIEIPDEQLKENLIPSSSIPDSIFPAFRSLSSRLS